ncbi:cell envelope biogenesis protein TolA [Tabrizicola sp. YIM 78059]|uniref:cell envelope biogenesis protein TolA n=1 Tax=Tabrizicola sp. YIM 78059 TaxID=2529861 RepID=UPI0010A9CD36|nr:cell envelope biogenesis protein TolA [Tabrizicola sp. YIM 78059]
MQTGTIYSGIGHAGVILWVLVGDWLFAPKPAEEIIATQVSILTSAEFAALQAAATPDPVEEPAPVRPQARPDPQPAPEPEPAPPPAPEPAPQPAPEPVPEPEPEPAPSDAVQAEVEQPLPSPSTEIQPAPRAAEIVAPSPVEVQPEVPTSDTPTPAVSDQPAEAEVVQETPTEETAPEVTGDVLLTEANRDQTAATGMTTSIRPRAKPERLAPPQPEPEVAAAAPPRETPQEQPVDNQATEDAIAALLAEAASEPAPTPAPTGGQNRPQGPPLTGGEMGDISSAIARRWNLGAASTDVLRSMVVIRVTFGPDGRPTDFQLIESNGPNQAAIDNLFQIARRAVNRTHSEGGIPLPPDKYDTWRVLDLVFDANGMRFR